MLNQLRLQLLGLWSRTTTPQRIVAGVLVVTGLALIGAFTWWASVPTYGVAFAGLTDADAGAIVEKIKAQNIPYRLESGGRILVPTSQIYDVRLSLAKDGLPGGSTVGYELFNNNTLGLTEFSQKVNYQRALEGELARTIESIASVKSARVHIVIPEPALFADQQQLTTASITVYLKPGERLDAAQVQSITHLVASGVEGLKPENVVIVDTEGQMLSAGFQADGVAGLSLTDDQRAAQRRYEAGVEAKVQDMLSQALGPNRSIVRASAVLGWDKVETTTQSFDPTPIVRSSSVISETYSGNGALPGGIPGTSSNLPAGTSPTYQTVITDTAGAGYQRSETTNNYEVSSTQMRTVTAPGQVQKLSVSVLVDGVADAQTLESITQIVTLAAGVDAARGDQVTVQSLAFDRTFLQQQAADMESAEQLDLYVRLGTWGALAMVFAAALWFIQRLLANLRLRAGQDAWTTLLAPPGAQPALAGAGAPASAARLSARPAAAAAIAPPTPESAALALEAAGLVAAAAAPPMSSPELERLQRAVTRMVEARPSAAAEAIRIWLDEDERRK